MTSLKEYLDIQADEALRTKEERQQVIEEWTKSISDLISKIRNWLHESDTHQILEFYHFKHRLREEKLGSYDAPGLEIRLNAREVKLLPISRYNVGPFLRSGEVRVDRSSGRMDLTEGGRKYKLYRDRLEPADHWVIVDDEVYVPRNLDRETFEAAFLDLLQ